MAAYSSGFLSAPESSLSRYMREIHKFPMLTPEEEHALATAYRETGELEAAHRMVTSHLRLVAKIAASYRGYGLPMGEVISEGNVGLMQAVRRFEPERGFRLATYAMRWIRASIQDYVLRSWSLVRIGTTSAQKKLFFNLRRLKGQMRQFEEGDLSAEVVRTIAERLVVSEAEVVNMNRRLAHQDQSLNASLWVEGEGEWQDMLEDGADDQETILAEQEEVGWRRGLLANAMRVLSERERHILTERRLRECPTTLGDLSQRYDISRERVRQIEVRAFEKLQKFMRSAPVEGDPPHSAGHA